MGFESILNTVWLVLGAIALSTILGRTCKGRSPALCFIGVGLVITTLFPIISASDDVIRIQHLQGSRREQRNHSKTDGHGRTSDNLIRLYEAMESSLASSPVQISFTLSFAFLTTPSCGDYARQGTIAQSGRSPPSLT